MTRLRRVATATSHSLKAVVDWLDLLHLAYRLAWRNPELTASGDQKRALREWL